MRTKEYIREWENKEEKIKNYLIKNCIIFKI